MTEITSKLSTALADRYRIERHLGEGGMATVYLAEDLKHKRKVAVKVLRPELAAVLGAERFVQEITTTANLQHPHILPLFDSGTAGEGGHGGTFLYYVMPYIEGETLRDKLNRETQLGIDEAVKITTEIADALDYAHRNGVIHRDIKPENILLHDGRPMVADFGIALAVSAAAGGRMTETGLSLGTPHYMSPEQATAEKDLTNRSDIYSLGSVLYEMLTGEPPHIGGSAQAIIMKIVTEPAPPVTKIRKSVPPHVAAATAKSLEKLAADRFESAAAFAGALTNPAFAASAPEAARQSRTGRAGFDRARTALAFIAPVLLIVALWGWLRPTPRPVSRYEIALSDAQPWTPIGWASVAISPDGERFVYRGMTEQGPRLLIRERDRLEAVALPGTEDAANPFFSPDGKWVGFFTTGRQREIRRVALAGGPPITVTDSAVGLPGATWGVDGYIYYDALGIGPLLRVKENGGSPQPAATLDSARGEVQHNWPEALPNGRGMLMVVYRGGRGSGRTEADIAILDLQTGEHTVLVRGVFARYAASGHLVYVTVDGTLMAVPFDQDRMTLSGDAVSLVEGIKIRPSGGAVDLSVSNDGMLLYVTGSSAADAGMSTLEWVARDGSAEEVIPGWRDAFRSLALSPDGTKLAVTIGGGATSDIWMQDLSGARARSRLTFEGSRNAGPAWTPDGRSVTFQSNATVPPAIYVARADGSRPPQLLLAQDFAIASGRYSADGGWIVFFTGQFGQGDIFGIRPGMDSVATPLLTSDFFETAPALSPDGRWLAYVLREAGESNVYVRPFPGMDARVQVSASGGSEPMWAHSGRELFYRNGLGQMMSVEVTAGASFTIGEQRVLFSAAPFESDRNYTMYALTPDDQRFIMVRGRAQEEAGRIVVVENFFEELRAKVGNE